MITLENISFTYNTGSADALPALQDVSLTLQRGELVAVIGRNGSGKSTLARILSGALQPTAGVYRLAGVDRLTPDAAWQVRRRVGMVFQRPDDQLIAASVIDDIAFGPENLGVPAAEIDHRIQAVLNALDLRDRASAAISELSAGEKQRVAIAGVLVMQPDCLILDEPTSMLAAEQARRVLALVHGLRERSGAAVLHVTHTMAETVNFDRLLVFSAGRLILDGPPRQVFAERATLAACGLQTPFVTSVGFELAQRGMLLPQTLLTADELLDALSDTVPLTEATPATAVTAAVTAAVPPPLLLRGEHLAFTYLADTPQAAVALRDVSFSIGKGRTLAILGGSQAGKSTLLDLVAGLRAPSQGQITLADHAAGSAHDIRTALQRQTAIVFQQPEDQLVEPIVGMDVAIGPRRRGCDPAASRAAVAAALQQVGLDYEAFRLRYVHALSGGQRRRVAIAGALANQPAVLLLDEPAAGLDPQGRNELAALLRRLTADATTTVVIASAALNELTLLADDFLILADGTSVLQTTRADLLADPTLPARCGIELPEHLQLAAALRHLLPAAPLQYTDAAELAQALMRQRTR